MDPVYAALVSLATLELEERRLAEVVRQTTRKLAAAEAALTAARARVAEVEATLRAHRQAVGPLEEEVRALEVRRRRAQEALDQGAIGEEAGSRQVALLRERIDALEDEGLTHLEAVDGLTASLEAARADAVAAEQAWSDAQLSLRGPRAAAEAAQGALATRVDAALAALPAFERGAVSGCRARKGYATAAADDGTCAGCHTVMPLAKRGELKQGRMVTCAGCGRWLVVDVPAFSAT